jgi:hypothetical protein
VSESIEQQYLRELATYGDRKLILWQLAANGRDFTGVGFTAKERGKEDAPIAEQVKAFVDDMTEDGEVRPEYEEIADWDALEETYGEQATEILQGNGPA